MKDETRQWLRFAEENLKSAKLLESYELYNPCLQNIQQCVEKSLKSVMVERSLKLRRTHSIAELKNILEENGFNVDLDDEECEFLDSIYLPSKYPLGNLLPNFEPDAELCNRTLKIADKVYSDITTALDYQSP